MGTKLNSVSIENIMAVQNGVVKFPESGAAALHGPAGSGKSSLIQAFLLIKHLADGGSYGGKEAKIIRMGEEKAVITMLLDTNGSGFSGSIKYAVTLTPDGFSERLSFSGSLNGEDLRMHTLFNTEKSMVFISGKKACEFDGKKHILKILEDSKKSKTAFVFSDEVFKTCGAYEPVLSSLRSFAGGMVIETADFCEGDEFLSPGERKYRKIRSIMETGFSFAAFDNLDEGLFEEDYAEIVRDMADFKGQVFFTARSLAAMEILPKKNIYVTSMDPGKRYGHVKGVCETNSLKNVYKRQAREDKRKLQCQKE